MTKEQKNELQTLIDGIEYNLQDARKLIVEGETKLQELRDKLND